MQHQFKIKNANSGRIQRSQHGAALILIMFMLAMTVVAFMIKSVNSGSLEFQQKDKTTQALNAAKDALMSWAVSHSDYPGQLPWPDRNGDGNYDGGSDCATTSFATTLFIGQLPIKPSTNPCLNYPGLGSDFLDSGGNRLWYAISRNLVRNYQATTNPIINPGMIDSSIWMRVLDRNGNLISDRVAAVIIAPGLPLPNQARSGIPDVTEYLDRLQIGATVYSNQDYDSDNEDFITAPDSARHPSTDSTYQSPYYFNDRLVYITIDELMAALEKRVASEVKSALKSYKTTYTTFPYATPLGSTKNYSCVDNQTTGLLPIDSAKGTSCSCSSNQNCTCNFTEIQKVVIDSAQDWETATGSCSIDSGKCSCTGTGACSYCNGFGCLFGIGVKTVSCNGTTGNCASATEPSTFTYYNVFTNSDVNSSSGSCSHTCGSTTISCNGAGSFSNQTCADPGIAPKITATIDAGENDLIAPSGNFITQNIVAGMYITGTGIQDDTRVSSVTGTNTLLMSKNAAATGTFTDIRISRLKKWFFDNGWQNYVYYAMTKGSPTLTVGTKAGVNALLVTAGKPITSPFAESKNSAAQTRISCNLNDYLDSTQNTNADLIYDATNKQRKQNYNDQMFIVAP